MLDTACAATVSSFLSASSADVALESPEEFVFSAELLAVDSLTAELSATVAGAELEEFSVSSAPTGTAKESKGRKALNTATEYKRRF